MTPAERSAVTPTERALHRAGLTYATADDILDNIRSVALRLATTTGNARDLRHRRDILVAEACALAAPREAVADATRLSRHRAHAIAQRQAAN